MRTFSVYVFAWFLWPMSWTWSALACSLSHVWPVAWYDSLTASVVSCDSQPTPRSTSTHLELGGCLSISLFSIPPLQSHHLLLTPLAFSLSTHSSPLLSHPLLSMDHLLLASVRHLLLLSFHPPPPSPLLLLRPPESLSSMAGQGLLCHTWLILCQAEFQVHSLTWSWSQSCLL